MAFKITITREQFGEFIRGKKETETSVSKRTQHYLEYFDRYQSNGKQRNWNWAAFSLWPVWFFYRKMYGLFLGSGIINSFLLRVIDELEYRSSLLETQDLTTTIMMGLLILAVEFLPYFYVGMFGDYFYLRYAQKKITKGITRKTPHHWIVTVIVMILVLMVGTIGTFLKGNLK